MRYNGGARRSRWDAAKPVAPPAAPPQHMMRDGRRGSVVHLIEDDDIIIQHQHQHEQQQPIAVAVSVVDVLDTPENTVVVEPSSEEDLMIVSSATTDQQPPPPARIVTIKRRRDSNDPHSVREALNSPVQSLFSGYYGDEFGGDAKRPKIQGNLENDNAPMIVPEQAEQVLDLTNDANYQEPQTPLYYEQRPGKYNLYRPDADRPREYRDRNYRSYNNRDNRDNRDNRINNFSRYSNRNNNNNNRDSVRQRGPILQKIDEAARAAGLVILNRTDRLPERSIRHAWDYRPPATEEIAGNAAAAAGDVVEVIDSDYVQIEADVVVSDQSELIQQDPEQGVVDAVDFKGSREPTAFERDAEDVARLNRDDEERLQQQLVRDREMERERQMDLERQREFERQRERAVELARERQLQLEREREHQVQLERERGRERQVQLDREREAELERQREVELERERAAVRSAELDRERILERESPPVLPETGRETGPVTAKEPEAEILTVIDLELDPDNELERENEIEPERVRQIANDIDRQRFPWQEQNNINRSNNGRFNDRNRNNRYNNYNQDRNQRNDQDRDRYGRNNNERKWVPRNEEHRGRDQKRNQEHSPESGHQREESVSNRRDSRSPAQRPADFNRRRSDGAARRRSTSPVQRDAAKNRRRSFSPVQRNASNDGRRSRSPIQRDANANRHLSRSPLRSETDNHRRRSRSPMVRATSPQQQRRQFNRNAGDSRQPFQRSSWNSGNQQRGRREDENHSGAGEYEKHGNRRDSFGAAGPNERFVPNANQRRREESPPTRSIPTVPDRPQPQERSFEQSSFPPPNLGDSSPIKTHFYLPPPNPSTREVKRVLALPPPPTSLSVQMGR